MTNEIERSGVVALGDGRLQACPGADDPEDRCPRHPSECTCWQIDPDHPMMKRAAPQPLHTTNCCKCGRIIDTREKKDGGDDFGAQLNDGRWTCSIECDDAVVDQMVTVKTLEWRDSDATLTEVGPIYSSAVGAGYTYIAEALDMSLAEAKAEKQKEFEQRVISALVAPHPVINPTHSQVAGTPGLLTDPAPSVNSIGGFRPCFASSAQENEFEMIVRMVVLNINHCGEDHARINAKNLAGVSHDPEVIMRCAKVDFEAAGGKRL